MASGIGYYARTTPDAVALLAIGGTRSFADLDERQRALAGLLRSGGIAQGDRIAVLASNRTELLEITIGALRTGVVPVPVNALLTEPEVAYLLEDSAARWLFTDRQVRAHPGLERVVTMGDAYERCLHDATPLDISDVALTRPMHYTSGTTGRSKGVWVPPASPEASVERSAQFRDSWGLSSEDTHLICSPLAHSAPHRFSLRTLEAGGRVAVQSHFEPLETLAAIELFGATSTFMVPTHLERIFSLTKRQLRRHDVSTVRLLAHAGAPIREVTKRKAIEFFPPGSVWEFYGSTEGQATRISTEEWLQKPGSVGTARPGAEILITDSDGTRLPSGEVGEVWVRDPALEHFEYWKDPIKTRSAWRESAFSVGDLGWLDEDGYLFLTGRKHDTIITGGVNVYPQEIEEVLVSHPAVAEAVVYAVPHDEWGQEVRAAVVPAPEQPLDPELLRTWARAQLAGFKCPRVIEVVAELERTPTGKVLRRPPRSEGN